MRPVIKKTITKLLIVIFILSNCVISYAISTPIEFLAHDISYSNGSWVKHSEENWSYESGNISIKNKFFINNTLWYLTNNDGFMVTGFVKYNDNFYYFLDTDDEKRGALAVQKTFKTKNGYYSTTKSGRVLKSADKIEYSEKYYDFDSKKIVDKRNNGNLFLTEITEPGIYRSIDDDVYGFIRVYNENGYEIVKATGMQIIDGYYYVFDENGKAKTGVVKWGDELHYCLPSGERKGIVALGEFTENGRTYTTDTNGNIVSIK